MIARLLLYPIIYSIARPLYGLWIGKALLALSGKLGLLVRFVTAEEKQGIQKIIFEQMPEPCAALALAQWNNLQSINDHRRKICSLFLAAGRTHNWPIIAGACEGLPLQKLPLFVPNADLIRMKLKKQNILLHDGWTGCVVCPDAVDSSNAGYEQGSDPAAELACMQILSLPTHPTMTESQAHMLIRVLDPLLGGQKTQKPITQIPSNSQIPT